MSRNLRGRLARLMKAKAKAGPEYDTLPFVFWAMLAGNDRIRPSPGEEETILRLLGDLGSDPDDAPDPIEQQMATLLGATQL